MNIVLTGATGFLGSALARRWVADGHRVTALVRASSSLARLDSVVDQLDLAVVDNDASIIDRVAAEKPSVIVHTACVYGRRGESTLQLFDANIRLGVLLLEGAAGRGSEISFLNTATVLEPSVSSYAMSKHQFSAWGRATALDPNTRLRFIDIRLQHLYGPGDDPSKFPTHVIRSCRASQPVLALTKGEQQRDFIYVDDAVAAYSAILANLAAFDGYEAIDVGSGVARTIRSFVETAHRLSGSQTVLDFGSVPYRPNEAMFCLADSARMNALGWRPVFDIESGIRNTIEVEAAM